MAKILCTTSGLTGILYASFELVHRLSRAGHELKYASPRNVTEVVNVQGIDFVQLPEINTKPYNGSIPAFKGPLKKVNRWIYKIRHADKRQQAALANINPLAFANLLEDWQPDLLIADVELHEYIFKAYGKKVPVVLLSQWFSIWKRPGLPYLLTDTIPGKGWRGQALIIALHWQWITLKRRYIFFKQYLYSQGTDRRSTLRALAKAEGFPLKWIKENYWPGPFTYAQLPAISMTPREMEFPHIERQQHFYVGPMVCENRKEDAAGRAAHVHLQTVFEYKKRKKAALIYCSVSTLSKGDHRFLRKVIKAVKENKNWVLVMTTGALNQEALADSLGENIFTFSYVPQLEVLREADCAINHGGIHTINECVYFAVPMLVYSGKRSDQNGCAARVAYHEIGIMADKDKDEPEDIRAKIKALLENQHIHQNLQTLQRQCLKYKEDGFVEQIINSFLPSQSD